MNQLAKMTMVRNITEDRDDTESRRRDDRGRFTSRDWRDNPRMEYESNARRNEYNRNARNEYNGGNRNEYNNREEYYTRNESDGRGRSEDQSYADTFPVENGNSPMEGDPTRGPSRGSSGFEAARRNYSPRGEYGDGSFRGELNGMRMIGFNGGAEMNYRYPRIEDEINYRSGQKESDYAHSEAAPKLDRETAKEWVKSMRSSLDENEKGEHWSYEQANNILQQKGYKHKPADWYAILNAMYNDYGKVAKKYGQIGNQEFFVDMAHAWLDDKDAVEDKAAMYYFCIAK